MLRRGISIRRVRSHVESCAKNHAPTMRQRTIQAIASVHAHTSVHVMRSAAGDSGRRRTIVPRLRSAGIVHIFRITALFAQRPRRQRANGPSEPRMLLLRSGLDGGESARHWTDTAGCGRNEARRQNLRRIVIFGRFGVFGGSRRFRGFRRFIGFTRFTGSVIIGGIACHRPFCELLFLANRFRPIVFLRSATPSGKRGQRIAGDRFTRIILLDSKSHRISHRRASFSRS